MKMDYLHVDLFEFDKELPLQEVVNVWKKRKLWFFKVEKKEEVFYTVQDENGKFLLEQTGRKQKFSNQKLAEEALDKAQLVNAKVLPNDYVYYTAQDDTGRYIKNAAGVPLEYLREEHALKFAISYNNDLVKIRQSAANYRVK